MATNPTLLTQPIAANGAKNVIPNTTSTAGAMSQDQGFPAETALPLGAGGVAPSREDFNGAFNLLSGLMFYAQKGWQFEFDEAQDYYAGCIVRDPLDSKLYEALNDVPASSTHPSADSVNWQPTSVDISNKANITLNNLDIPNLSYGVVTAQLLAQNGYIKFSNGLLIQWGSYTSASLFGSHTFTYPIAFTELYSVTGGFSGTNNWVHMVMYTESGVNRLEGVMVGAASSQDASANGYAAYYIAFGR